MLSWYTKTRCGLRYAEVFRPIKYPRTETNDLPCRHQGTTTEIPRPPQAGGISTPKPRKSPSRIAPVDARHKHCRTPLLSLKVIHRPSGRCRGHGSRRPRVATGGPTVASRLLVPASPLRLTRGLLLGGMRPPPAAPARPGCNRCAARHSAPSGDHAGRPSAHARTDPRSATSEDAAPITPRARPEMGRRLICWNSATGPSSRLSPGPGVTTDGTWRPHRHARPQPPRRRWLRGHRAQSPLHQRRGCAHRLQRERQPADDRGPQDPRPRSRARRPAAAAISQSTHPREKMSAR